MLVLVVGMIGGLAGCATPADPTRMTVASLPVNSAFPDALRRAVCVRSVTGGEDTNPLWASKVGSEDFRGALTASLDAAGLTASAGACKYSVDVNLLGLSQPSMGFSFEVTSHVNYKVYDPTGRPILLETISAAYTAEFSEAPIGIVRLKRANEGSIRTSITQFLDKLRVAKPT